MSRDLAVFVAAVESGSIQGAAEALDLTQSAATKRIQALERRLGTELLVRSRTGVRASADGEALYPEARRAIDALTSAERSVVASRAAPAAADRRQPHRRRGAPAGLAGRVPACRPGAPSAGRRRQLAGAIATVRAGDAEVGSVEGLDRSTDWSRSRWRGMRLCWW